MNRRHLVLSLAATLSFALLAGPALAQKKSDAAAERAGLHKDVNESISSMRKTEPGIEKFFKSSVGYAVFPRVGKGGFIFAGGHGDGELFEKGQVVGTASVTIVTVGFTVGAQQFSEIVFFKDAASLDRFKQGKFEVTAGVSIVLLKKGATNDVDYRDGVVVVAHPRTGAMVDAAIGGQKFSYKPGK